MSLGDDRRDEARRILERADRDSERLGSTSFTRTARRVGDHFAGRDAALDDPIEVWGRRVGRALSVLLAFGLLWLLGFQLGWW